MPYIIYRYNVSMERLAFVIFPVDRRAGLAPVLVLWHDGISPASTPDLRRELSSLTQVLVLHKSRCTPLTLASGGHQAL